MRKGRAAPLLQADPALLPPEDRYSSSITEYVIHDGEGRIVQQGAMAIGFIEDAIARGEPYVIGKGNMSDHKVDVAKGVIRPKTKADRDREAKARADAEAARPYYEKRAFEYPPMHEFMEAFTEERFGDDTKMKTYLAKVEAVRRRYPKDAG